MNRTINPAVVTNTARAARWPIAVVLILGLSLPAVANNGDDFVADDFVADDFVADAEQEIGRLVNDARRRNRLPELSLHAELARVARDHSYDMLNEGFFAHTNRRGQSANARIVAGLPQVYLMGTAENIAWTHAPSSLTAESAVATAARLFDQWMGSPGHRANILHDSMTHVGVGLAIGGGKVYGTQNFMAFLVELVDRLPGATLRGHDPALVVRVNPAVVDPDRFVVRVGLPDADARWTAPSGGFYRGVAFLSARDLGDNEFAVTLPTREFGFGRYTVRFGDSGGTTTYARAWEFDAQQ